MALLLILMALLSLVFTGFSSSMRHSSSPQKFRASPSTTHVQKSVTRTHVTVRAHATAKSSVSCTARTRIKGASVQTSRHCRYGPVIP